jgi:Protein of unknown function (DUF998)
MTALAGISATLVFAWVALVVAAQLLNPDQSPLALGMSGLARGRYPWAMKASFVVRGLSALALVAALPAAVSVTGWVLPGAALFWVWGLGSAALALADTDMPGEPPTSTGAAHAMIGLVTYVAGASGAILLSLTMLRNEAAAGGWALSLAVIAAAAMVVQFVAFGAAAREARSAAPAPFTAERGNASAPATLAPGSSAPVGAPGTAPGAPAPCATAPAMAAASAAGIPPQLGAPFAGGTAPRAGGRPAASSAGLRYLAGHAGLFQRVFVGLLMVWTLVVAFGIAL